VDAAIDPGNEDDDDNDDGPSKAGPVVITGSLAGCDTGNWGPHDGNAVDNGGSLTSGGGEAG
jgi:hypothetical protein